MMNSSSKLSSPSASDSKSKPKNASRSPGKLAISQHKSAPIAEGVYSNGRLMHTMTSLVGNVAQVVLKDGTVYEGVLKTFSPMLDVVLESVIEVDKKSATDRGCTITSLLDSLKAKKSMVDTMIFELQNIVSVDLLAVDLDYAFKDGFKTDTEISGMKNSKVEKELVAWIDDTPVQKRGTREDSLEPTNGQTGWSAQDMFAYNEKVNGVVVGYKGLENVYTTAINRNDPGYLEKERIAEELAKSIMGQPSRTNVEDEDDHRDDADKYTNVSRNPRQSKPQFPGPNPPGRKPSDGNWRDTNPRAAADKMKPSKTMQEPAVIQPRSKNQEISPKTVVGSQQPELFMKTSNPPISKASSSSKEQTDGVRPISFAAAVGLSDPKSNIQNSAPRPVPVVTSTDQDSKPVEANEPAHGVNKYRSGESSKPDSMIPKKNDAPESDPENVVKKSVLNPNAKEFTLNPSAKPFTPKSHFSPPPTQPLIANHPVVPQHNLIQPACQPNQQVHAHQQHKHHPQQASQYLVMGPSGSNMVMPHQQVIGPNGQPFQILNPMVVNQIPGGHNSNQYSNVGYNHSGGNQQSRKSHHSSRESRQGSGHSRHENNSYNPHNVAAATGHPVLGAPLTASGPMQFNHHQGGPGHVQQPGPGGQPMFPPMFVQGYPRMFQPPMIGPYDPQYFMQLSMVQPTVQSQQQQQPNNGQHSTPSTPQSQTPSTPGLHGPSTPGPAGHAVIPQTPSPQQPALMYQGQPMHGATFNPTMVMMPPHPGLGPNPHIQSGQVMIPSSASGMTPGSQIPSHFNQNQQPPPTQRPI